MDEGMKVHSVARMFRRIAALAFVALAVAGCDKCGNRIQFVAPSVQHACGDNAGPR